MKTILKEYLRIAGYVLLGLVVGFLLGLITGIFIIPHEIIIIKNVPTQTLPGIVIP